MKRIPALIYYKDAPMADFIEYTHIDIECPYCGDTIVYRDKQGEYPDGVTKCEECDREFEVFDCEHIKETEETINE
jgi:DNA-directed RNA polymerase subunit RPC12/RpoP